jgi:hypothetical protein
MIAKAFDALAKEDVMRSCPAIAGASPVESALRVVAAQRIEQ